MCITTERRSNVDPCIHRNQILHVFHFVDLKEFLRRSGDVAAVYLHAVFLDILQGIGIVVGIIGDFDPFALLLLVMLVAIYYPLLLSTAGWLLGGYAPALTRWELTQMFSVCALPLMRKYNGKKGSGPASPVLAKLTQLGFYLFYPAHMLLLWLLRFV